MLVHPLTLFAVLVLVLVLLSCSSTAHICSRAVAVDNRSADSEIMLVGNEGSSHHGFRTLLVEMYWQGLALAQNASQIVGDSPRGSLGRTGKSSKICVV